MGITQPVAVSLIHLNALITRNTGAARLVSRAASGKEDCSLVPKKMFMAENTIASYYPKDTFAHKQMAKSHT